jgi:putative hydrolase of the HAD superfamily
MTRVAAVSFDANGTLVHTPRMGEIYHEVLARHGVEADPDRLAATIHRVWEEMACRARPGADRFAEHPGGARGFWRRFLERVCEHLELPRSSPFAAAELFDRFADAAAWEVYPEVRPTLARLRRDGLRLAVVSDWDERLPLLLDRLELSGYLETVVYSQAAGAEKPHPLIFGRLLAKLGLEPGEVLHVGDSRRRDLEGALAVGMAALLVDRDGGPDALRSLVDLPLRVAELR